MSTAPINEPEPSTHQIFAALCFRMLEDMPEAEPPTPREIAALEAISGGHFHPQEVLQMSLKLRNDSRFSHGRKHLLAKWQGKRGKRFSEHEAYEFIQDYFNNPELPFNSARIFDNDIVAGRTLLERGKFTDKDGVYPGDAECWTLQMTLDGEALILSEEMEYRASAGDLFLYKPSAAYRCGLHPAALTWDHYWVLFQPKAHLNQWLNWRPLAQGIQHMQLSPADVPHLKNLLGKLLTLKDDNPPYLKELQYNMLEEILIRAAGSLQTQQSAGPDRRVMQACEYMEQHLSRPIRIDDIADRCNLSPSRLSHLFKQEMGVSLKAWNNNARLQMARKLLVYSDLYVSQIATQVGFDDANLFAKTFKKNTGCTPSEFRHSFGTYASRKA